MRDKRVLIRWFVWIIAAGLLLTAADAGNLSRQHVIDKVLAAGTAYNVIIDTDYIENGHMYYKKDDDGIDLTQQYVSDNMIPVIIYAKDGYYFPVSYEIEENNGISVTRVDAGSIKVDGTPTAYTKIELLPATEKTTPDAPAGVTGGILEIVGTTTAMEYADSTKPNTWTDCTDKKTTTTAGTKYVRYKATESTNAGAGTSIKVAANAGYSVTILNPDDSHITIWSESEDDDKQIGVNDGVNISMKSVYYYADAGYCFPATYKVNPVNGVKVSRSSASMIIVSGTPTKDTTITLEPASAVETKLYTANVVNGTGGGQYAAGTAVNITAQAKDGQTFTNWKVNSGSVSFVNDKSQSTSFVMGTADVEVEACYSNSSGSKGENNSSENNGNNNGNNNENNGSNNSGNNGSSDDNSKTVTPVSEETKTSNSKTLDISARVSWNSNRKIWSLTWSPVTGASGYRIYYGKGKNSLTAGRFISNPGNGSTTASIKRVNGVSVDRTKTYEFQVEAYRQVSKDTIEVIGKSRVLYAAGVKHKTYTNAKKISPTKKTLSVKVGKKVKITTKVTKQTSSKKLLKNSAGKKLTYISTNEGIATVTSSGKVIGVKQGSCTIYILAHNGVRSKVTVNVK